MESPQIVMDATIRELRAAGMQLRDSHMVGSSYILGHGKDIDVLVLVDDAGTDFTNALFQGFSPDCEEIYAGAKFCSLRKGGVNLLITGDRDFYEGFVMAAKVCKLLGVSDKDARITVHNLIRDGVDPYEDIFE